MPKESLTAFYNPFGPGVFDGVASDPDLTVASDFGVMGPEHARFAASGVVPVRMLTNHNLEVKLRKVIKRHAPSAFKYERSPEIHVVDLLHTADREKSAFRDLGFAEVRTLLLGVADCVGAVMPFTVATVTDMRYEDRGPHPSSKEAIGNGLLRDAVGRFKLMCAEELRTFPDGATFYVDRGDGFAWLKQRGNWYDPLTEKFGDLGAPSNESVSSAEHRAVQVADLAASVAGRLLVAHARCVAEPNKSSEAWERCATDRNFWMRLANAMNLSIEYLLNTPLVDEASRPWLAGLAIPEDLAMCRELPPHFAPLLVRWAGTKRRNRRNGFRALRPVAGLTW
jgi:hypothetical protein